LTEAEYELLQREYVHEIDPLKVDYIRFNLEIENIFTDSQLEKNPIKQVTQFQALSILDNKSILNAYEETELH